MRDSARSLMVVFIACAPPVRELMGISAPTRLKSIAPGASRHLVAGGVSARGREWKIDGWRAFASSGFEIFAAEGHFFARGIHRIA